MMGNGIPAGRKEREEGHHWVLLSSSGTQIMKYLCEDFMLQIWNPSLSSLHFFPERRRAPAKLCQVQSSLLGPDPHKLARTCHCVTRRETEAPDNGITVIYGGRLGYWLLTRETNGSTYVWRAPSGAVRAQPAASQQGVSHLWILSTSLALKCHQSAVEPHHNLLCHCPDLDVSTFPEPSCSPTSLERCCKVQKMIY